jgi:hypothetical protein
LVIGYWLLVIGYWLLVIGYWLLVIGYWLLVIGYWLLVIGSRSLQIVPFFFIRERNLSLLLPFSQFWEKGLGDEGVNYLSRQF